MAAIYRDDPRFGTTLAKTSCPRQRDICDNDNVNGVLSISNGTPYTIPSCSDRNKFKFTLDPDESPYGCCVVDTSQNDCNDFDSKLQYTNADDYSMGIDFIDVSLNNPAMLGERRKICHSAPIRARTIKLDKFFITIVLSTVAIIGAALMGGCYEFWFKYGTKDTQDTDRCYNIGGSVSQIEFSFPTNIEAYPYKTGTEFKLPYSWLQFEPASTNISDSDRYWLSCFTLGKAFKINFLLMLIFSRMFISKALTVVSTQYKKLTDPIFKNAVFLVISGILFYIISETTGIQQWNIGIGFIFFLLLIVVAIAMIFVLIAAFVSYLNNSNYNSGFSAMTGVILESRHELFHGIYYPVWGLPKNDPNRGTNFIYNIPLIILSFITGICAIGTGFLGAILGLCYMVISLFCNIFFVPLFMGTKCLFKIITEHSELLIILFCLSIVISSHLHLNPTTTIVIALLVGIIVLYKMYTVLNSKSK